MKLNSPEGEAYMQREAEHRQRERWEKEPADDDDLLNCEFCGSLVHEDDLIEDTYCSEECLRQNEADLCANCSGSGEGMYPGTTCTKCAGRGVSDL